MKRLVIRRVGMDRETGEYVLDIDLARDSEFVASALDSFLVDFAPDFMARIESTPDV